MLSTAMVAHKTNTSPMPADDVIRNFDWDKVNLDATAIRLRDLMRNGVPAAIRYTYSDDVLALYGMDFNLLEGALRHPERVEVRPESFTSDKRYPVLGFHRGDVSVILGLRQPITPKVIAAYAASRLAPDITGWFTPVVVAARPPRQPAHLSGHGHLVTTRIGYRLGGRR